MKPCRPCPFAPLAFLLTTSLGPAPGPARAEPPPDAHAGHATQARASVLVDNVTDPVCGMRVSRVPEELSTHHQGATLGFCSKHCLHTWESWGADKKAAMTASMGLVPRSGPAATATARLPKPGEKIPLDAGHTFVYGFTERPKLGTAIMRVEIFTLDGARDTSFDVTGDADMPSMRGAHATGGQEFKRSAKGTYLLPVRLVMPGTWEVTLTFRSQGRTVLRGIHSFDL